MIVDRLYDLEGLLAARARPAAAAGSTQSQAKTKPVSFPMPKYESNGELKAVPFYRWFFSFVRMVEQLHLPHEVCLSELANNSRMLPAELRQIAYGADSLSTALSNIRDRFTPLEGLWPQMSDELLLTPKCKNNQERLDASGHLLTTLSLLQSWFPQHDIRKEDFVFVVHQLESTDGDGNLQLLHDMTRYDQLQRLPRSDPNHRSYVHSLHSRLEELRKLWTQMAASLDVAARIQVSNQARSWSASVRPPPPPARPPPSNPPPSLSGPPPQGPLPVKKAQCPLCRNSNLELHKIYNCPLLPELREKKYKLPPGICLRCATKIGDKPHDKECHLKTDRKTGEKYSLACSLHQDPVRHKKLCQDCGPNLPEPKKKKPKVSHRAARVVPPVPPVTQPSSSPFQQVQFLTEVVMLKGKDGTEAPTRISYDCGGGIHFLKTTVPENFQWGPPEKMSEVFQLSTVTGMEEIQLPEVQIRILGQQGSEHPLSAMVSDFVDNEVFFLDQETAKKCNIKGPTKEQYDQTQYSLILGISAANLFPKQMETPKILQKRYPGITLLRSVLTNQVLFQGPMPPSASSFSARAFSSWTPQDGTSEPGEQDEDLVAQLHEVDSTPTTTSPTAAPEARDTPGS